MAFNSITDVFSGASIVSGEIRIPSGTLVSNDSPVSSNPSEIVFGMLENISSSVINNNLQYISCSTTTSLVGSDTLRKTYNFIVDLDFNSSTIVEELNVKLVTTTTTSAP